MKQERVIAILDFYRDIDKTVTMNERVVRNLEDQYYSTLGAANSDGMPHGKGGVSQARRFYISVWRCRKRGRITATSRGRKTGDIRRNTSRA